jgi:hypothetical protein
MIDPLATAFFNDYLIIWGKNIIIALFFLLPLQDPLGTQGVMQDGSPSLTSHHGRHLCIKYAISRLIIVYFI